MEKRRPVYFLQMNPPGWKRSSLPKLVAPAGEILSENALCREDISRMNWSQRHDYLHSMALLKQEKCWEEATGVKPENASFTLIVPIHNEENSLPSFLGTLMLSNVPSTVSMQVIFVTNACNDLSVDILKTFFATLGNVEFENVLGDLHAEHLDYSCPVVKKEHQTYIHVNTSRAGKAYALGIGNRLARQSGHLIAMSIDANNFIEPDAIRNLFSQAYHAYRARPEAHDTVLFSGVGKEAQKRSRQKSVFGNTDTSQRHLVQVGGGVVNGWMMAWNTSWMESIGGPPEVALEDYALGVLARAGGFRIEQAENANVWGYVVTNFNGLIDTRARYVRGKKQICEYVKYDRATLSIIEGEAFYMKKFTARVKYVFSRLVLDPIHSPKYAATFVLWEYAIWKGMRAYKQNPTNQSWEKIESTY